MLPYRAPMSRRVLAGGVGLLDSDLRRIKGCSIPKTNARSKTPDFTHFPIPPIIPSVILKPSSILISTSRESDKTKHLAKSSGDNQTLLNERERERKGKFNKQHVSRYPA